MIGHPIHRFYVCSHLYELAKQNLMYFPLYCGNDLRFAILRSKNYVKPVPNN